MYLQKILKFSVRFKIILSLLIVLLITYSLLRLFFLIVNFNFYDDVTFSEILTAFLIGIRFDISSILMLNIPILVITFIPIKNFNQTKFRNIYLWSVYFTNILGIVLNIADFGYFPTIQRRMTFEPFTAVEDTLRMIPSLIISYFYLLVIFLLFAFIFFKVIKKIINKISSVEYSFSYKVFAFELIIIIIFTTIGIRGGFQLKPIRQTNAFFNDNRSLGYLALNTTYTVLRSYFQYSLPDFHFYSNKDVKSEIKELIFSKDESLVDSNYFFMRIKNPKSNPERKNIIIFIMESWSAQYIGAITGKKTCTPFFDSLANNGILFTNFFASGQRSIEAVPSILASIPAVFPTSFIGSRSETNKIRGLGSILKEYGYTTSFHHGALKGSMGFDGFVPSAGFDLYFGKEDFENFADSLFDGTWGIFDEPFFLDAAKKISRFNEPFCSVIFSLSSHDPFKIPSYKNTLFNKFDDEDKYQKAIRYSDYSLKVFFEYAKKQSWFDSTIFIFTADHTLYTARNDVFSSFNIPLLIYSPIIKYSKKVDKVGSHVDILPTILDLLSIKTIHSSMGASLLDNEKNGFAVTSFYPSYLFFSNNDLYVDDFDKKKQYFKDFRNTKPDENSYNENLTRIKELERKLKSYIQSVTKSVNNDLIYKSSF